jgi:hypothetical protein
MAVAVVRLEGQDIPLVLYFEDEVEAAKSAVELSNAEQS